MHCLRLKHCSERPEVISEINPKRCRDWPTDRNVALIYESQPVARRRITLQPRSEANGVGNVSGLSPLHDVKVTSACCAWRAAELLFSFLADVSLLLMRHRIATREEGLVEPVGIEPTTSSLQS